MNPKTIFLVDGLGAVASAVSLGLILPAFQPWIGMPSNVLRGLGVLACFFAIYSLTRYRFADLKRPLWLRGIIVLNLSYCLISLSFMVIHLDSLTTLGLAYFLTEKFIVLLIVGLELKVLKRLQTVHSFKEPLQ